MGKDSFEIHKVTPSAYPGTQKIRSSSKKLGVPESDRLPYPLSKRLSTAGQALKEGFLEPWRMVFAFPVNLFRSLIKIGTPLENEERYNQLSGNKNLNHDEKKELKELKEKRFDEKFNRGLNIFTYGLASVTYFPVWSVLLAPLFSIACAAGAGVWGLIDPDAEMQLKKFREESSGRWSRWYVE